jgi:hypothetical protein
MVLLILKCEELERRTASWNENKTSLHFGARDTRESEDVWRSQQRGTKGELPYLSE